MPRLLVFRTALANADPVKDVELLKDGDVVSVRADDVPWGADELALDHFRGVEVTDGTVTALSHLAEPEVQDIDESILPHIRFCTLDLLALETYGATQKGSALLTDDIISCTSAYILSIASQRDPISNPAYIGSPSNVIGP